MLIEELIYSALAAQSPPATSAGDRVYPLIAKQGSTLPRITYQRISTTPINDFQGSSNLDQVRIQVDSWAMSHLGARQLAAQVRLAMAGAEFKSTMSSEFDDYEPETRIYRVRQDYSCWIRPVA